MSYYCDLMTLMNLNCQLLVFTTTTALTTAAMTSAATVYVCEPCLH